MKKHYVASLSGLLISLSLVSGSAVAEEAREASVERCDAPKGTLAVNEPQNHVISALSRYGLPAPTALLRQFVQKSNCFQVVERGRAMQNIQQERQLAESGMLQQGSNMGKGQLVTADFVMTPDVLFSDNNAGGAGAGLGAAVGSLFGSAGSLIGAAVGGVKFKEAETTLLLADARSGLQVAAESGVAEQTDWAFGGILGPVGGGAYTSTDEGKIVAAALLQNYNNIVNNIKNNPSLLAPTSEIGQKNAAASLKAAAFAEGAVVRTKIGGAKLLESPERGATVVTKLDKGAELIYLGEEDNGYLLVMGEAGEGWVRSLMLKQ